MFIVTYDLVNNASLEDYERVIGGIKSSYPAAKKLTESCWLIPVASSTSTILLAMSRFVKSADRLLAAELKTFPLGKNLLSDVNPLAGLIRKPLGSL